MSALDECSTPNGLVGRQLRSSTLLAGEFSHRPLPLTPKWASAAHLGDSVASSSISASDQKRGTSVRSHRDRPTQFGVTN